MEWRSNIGYSPQKDENFSKRNFDLNNHEKPFLQDILGQHLKIGIWVDKNLKRELGRSLEERGWELKRVSQSVCNVQWVASSAREAWGPIIAPQENLVVGVSETRTCLGRGPDMSDQPLWNPTWGLDMSSSGLSCWGIGLGQTCSGWGPNIFGKCLYNPT
jgi:hypothetical protein